LKLDHREYFFCKYNKKLLRAARDLEYHKNIVIMDMALEDTYYLFSKTRADNFSSMNTVQ
jgi:hypothetical protein